MEGQCLHDGTPLSQARRRVDVIDEDAGDVGQQNTQRNPEERGLQSTHLNTHVSREGKDMFV